LSSWQRRCAAGLATGFGLRRSSGWRASFTGVSAANFTPANLTRALLEGMASTFREERARIQERLGRRFRGLAAVGTGACANLEGQGG
jgi:sugar (pentulose or hexulose) kinase